MTTNVTHYSYIILVGQIIANMEIFRKNEFWINKSVITCFALDEVFIIKCMAFICEGVTFMNKIFFQMQFRAKS